MVPQPYALGHQNLKVVYSYLVAPVGGHFHQLFLTIERYLSCFHLQFLYCLRLQYL